MFTFGFPRIKKDCQKLYGNLCPILLLQVSRYNTKKFNNSPITEIKISVADQIRVQGVDHKTSTCEYLQNI